MSRIHTSTLLADCNSLVNAKGSLELSKTQYIRGAALTGPSYWHFHAKGKWKSGKRPDASASAAVITAELDQAIGSSAESGNERRHLQPPSRVQQRFERTGLMERVLGASGPAYSKRRSSTSASASSSEASVRSNGVGSQKPTEASLDGRSTAYGNLGGATSDIDEQTEKEARLDEQHRREMLNLVDQLEAIKMHALDLEHRNAHQFEAADSRFRKSAMNLLHYMALRNIDIRKLQQALGDLGLSSLGRTEAHTLASIQAVSGVLRSMLRELPLPKQAGQMDLARKTTGMMPLMPATSELLPNGLVAPVMNFSEGDQLLERNTEDLLGPAPRDRKTHIMVTLPTEAAEDKGLVMQLMEAGMNVARVNCAHENPAVWTRIIEHVRCCSVQLGRPCRILMDLAGPKLRTGVMEAGVRIIKLKPPKDVLGRKHGPALVWLAPSGVSPAACDKQTARTIPVDAPEGWMKCVKEGSIIHFTDTRGKSRQLEVVAREEGKGGLGFWAECQKGAILQTGMELHLVGAEGGKKKKVTTGQVAIVGEVPAMESPIILAKGDTLLLLKGDEPGALAERDEKGKVVNPARVSCALDQVFDNVKVGEPIKLDDGKIEGVIKSVKRDQIAVKITRAALKGSKLKGEKAINLPDSDLKLHGLTAKDLVDLDFIAAHADMVAFSFVNDAKDVAMLQDELRKRDAADLGVVLKIETKKAFERLPWMLLQGMKSRNPLGVMIARGDMAVECGWERLAEVQEEILWLCEAAHVPAIWATQVLEGLAKAGLPSRAEITDAAMGERAECVMLNKGPHIVLAVKTLSDILSRMRSHQMKKQSMLRPLQVSNPFVNGHPKEC